MTQSLDLTTPTGVSLNLPIAGAGSRSYAYIIDWHIRIVVALLWILGWTWVFSPQALGNLQESSRSSILWLITFPSLFYTLYHPVVEVIMNGNSPGKNIAKIACVTTEGQSPSIGQILLRNFMRIIDSLPFLYTVGTISVVMTKEHVRLGDMAANTRVISLAEDSDKALAKLNQIENANINHEDAEFIQQLLARWGALSKDKQRAMASNMLARYEISAEKSQRKLRKQLEGLLTS